jgi:hypothetical protein
VDGFSTVKFAFIQWVGENVKPVAKAKVSTQKGALENHFKVSWYMKRCGRGGWVLLKGM